MPIFFVSILFVLCSCSSSTSLQASLAHLPSQFATTSIAAQRTAKLEPLDIHTMSYELDMFFKDDALAHLLELALERNVDAEIAQQRIIQARENLQAAWGGLFPVVSGNASGGVEHNSRSNANTTSKTIGLNMSWELDVFGKNWANKNAIQQSYLASISTLHNTQLILLADVCSSYFLLQNIAHNLEISQQNLELYENVLEATRLSTEAGTLDSTYLFDAQDNLTNAQIAYEKLKTSEVAAQNALMVLLNLKSLPPFKKVEQKPLPNIVLLSDLPASVLLERPDIKAQLHTLYAAAYQSSSANAALFPTLTLSGSLQNALQSPSVLTAQILGSLSAPLLNRSSINAQAKIAESVLKENELMFQNTINQALAEMENSLFDVQSNRLQFMHATNRLQNAKEYFSLFSARYEIGLIDSREFYSNHVSLNNAQIAINDTYLQNVQAYLALFKAFGGQINAEY